MPIRDLLMPNEHVCCDNGLSFTPISPLLLYDRRLCILPRRSNSRSRIVFGRLYVCYDVCRFVTVFVSDVTEKQLQL